MYLTAGYRPCHTQKTLFLQALIDTLYRHETCLSASKTLGLCRCDVLHLTVLTTKPHFSGISNEYSRRNLLQNEYIYLLLSLSVVIFNCHTLPSLHFYIFREAYPIGFPTFCRLSSLLGKQSKAIINIYFILNVNSLACK